MGAVVLHLMALVIAMITENSPLKHLVDAEHGSDRMAGFAMT